MPLVVVDGTVLYRRPKKDELPVIGGAYLENPLRAIKEREKHCLELSYSMSLLQQSLLEGNKNVVV
jgi:hypothetical protein